MIIKIEIDTLYLLLTIRLYEHTHSIVTFLFIYFLGHAPNLDLAQHTGIISGEDVREQICLAFIPTHCNNTQTLQSLDYFL